MRELSDGEREIQREAQRDGADVSRECDQCGAPLNPVAVMLGPTCGACCRENHARACGGQARAGKRAQARRRACTS